MTKEQAARLASAMSVDDREQIGATGNVVVEKCLRLADSLGMEVNEALAKEKQGALLLFCLRTEIARELPAHERRSAEKIANSMSPADLAKRMAKPKTTRPPPSENPWAVVREL